MTEFMLMVVEDEQAHAAQAPKATAELIEKRAQFAAALRRTGKPRDSGRFRPSKEAKRVGRKAGQLEVEHGPFQGEAKTLGAYYWVDAANVEEAAQLAASCPALPSDEIEVRPLMK